MKSIIPALAILALQPVPGFCQALSPPVVRADASASVGWFNANHTAPADCCNDWSASLFKGITAGYFLTDHVKTEIEVGWPGPTESYGYSAMRLPNGTFSNTFDEHRYRDVAVSVTGVYQFGHNATFHPFLLAGVDVDRQRDHVERRTQVGNSLLTTSEFDGTETRVRPVTGVGFKAYASERVFFRGQLKAVLGSSIERLAWTAGVGLDLPGRQSPAAARATPIDRSRDVPRGQESPEVWRRTAERLAPGALIDLTTAGGTRITGFLVSATDRAIVVKPRTRIPEAVREVPYGQIEQLSLHTVSSGAARAGAVAAGAGVGVGVFMTMLLVALSQLD